MTEYRDPFVAVQTALDAAVDDEREMMIARVDPGRLARTGVPEVVYGDAKDDVMLADACRRLIDRVPRVVVSRVEPERAVRIAESVGDNIEVVQSHRGRTVVMVRDGAPLPPESGFVAILTAGTSDLPAAGEAAIVARELGCRVEIVADVGVAGLHRLVRPLRRVMREGVDAIVVAAGMDGALPSVVAGLVDVPVIGLPTSVGYGVAAGGQAALMTMLATCSPGMAVVNIDNGVGAGATAALIATRANMRQPGD